MRINHNIAALNTYNKLSTNNASSAKSLEKLSSGLRINKAGDDAAGLAISEKMRAQIRGLDQASRNSQDAISLIQTAEGSLSETQSILQRMRELAVQAGTDTNVTIDRTQIQKEMNQLTSEINRIGNTTEFNTMKLLDGTREKTVTSSVASLNTGTIDIRNGTKVSTGGSLDMKAAVGSVTVATGEFASSFTTSNGGTINITMSTSTTLCVTVAGGTGGVTGTFSSVDTITKNGDGGFSYSNHGISFEIAATSVASLSVGESLEVGTLTATGSYATVSDYSVTGSTGTTTLSDFTVTAVNDNENARWITVSGIGSATTSGITVKTYTDSGMATVLTDDRYTVTAGTTSLAINDHGISFTIGALNELTAGAVLNCSISLTGVGTTDVATAWDDKSLKFQVGANQNQSLSLDIDDMRANALDVSSSSAGSQSVQLSDGTSLTAAYVASKSVSNGTNSTSIEYSLDVSTHDNAAAAVTVLNDAINIVSDQRAKLGSTQNRLEHTISNLDTAAENLQSSESRIRDVDMAKEMMQFTKNNILTQAAQAMLAQANQQPQGVLQLLR